MSSSSGTSGNNGNSANLVCRACLKEWGEMKNMYHWGLDGDFFRYTNLPRKQSSAMPELLCLKCVADLRFIKAFKDKCQNSDRILRLNLNNKEGQVKVLTSNVTSVLEDNRLIYRITAPNTQDKIRMKCPHECEDVFFKKTQVYLHMRKVHSVANDFRVEQQFYCSEEECGYNLTATPTKYFSGRKFLNQHHNKSHKDRIYSCENCRATFAILTDYYRHLKTCNKRFTCPLCKATYTTNEKFMVHLLRKHPNLHEKYKREKKSRKRPADDDNFELRPELIVLPPPKQLRFRNVSLPDSEATVEELPPTVVDQVPAEREPLEIKRFPPWQMNLEVVDTPMPSVQFIAKPEEIPEKKEDSDVGEVLEEFIIEEGCVDPLFSEALKDIEAIPNEIIIEETYAEDYCIQEEIDMPKEEKYEIEYSDEQKCEVECSDDQKYKVESSDEQKHKVKCSDDQKYEVECSDDQKYEVECSDDQKYEVECSDDQKYEVECSDDQKYEVECSDDHIGEESLEPMIDEQMIDDPTVSEEIDNLKKTSATQFPEDITNDVALNAWSGKNEFEIQTDEMSTQTVFQDLLEMKSQNSDDAIFFSESVSLSDIQTQTVPLEFGLSRSNKETQSCTSQTQPPDLSIKETQTCFCHYDPPKLNFGLFDSLSSSPASSNFISTETQTGSPRSPVRSDVLLSFSSAETQTCFEESSSGSL